MTNPAPMQPIGEAAARVVDKLRPHAQRVVPQSHDRTGELVNVRTLMKMGRNAEALERLERVLDRYHGTCRVGSRGAWG